MILKEYNEQSIKHTFIKTLGRKMSPKPPTPTKEDLPLDLTTNQRNSPDSTNEDEGHFKVPDSPSFLRGGTTADAPHFPSRSNVSQFTHDTRSKSCSSRVVKNSSINLFSSTRATTVANDETTRSMRSRLFKYTQVDNINNNNCNMRPPVSNIVRPGRINTRSSAVTCFSKATTSRPSRPITWRKMQRLPNSGNRKIKWVPAIRWAANSEEKCNDQWIPVRKFSTEKQPIFQPVELPPAPRNKSPEESPSLKFPWINPLNRIFLQETTTDAGEVDSNTLTGSSNSNDNSCDTGNFCDGNNRFSPKNSCSTTTTTTPFSTRNPLSFSSPGPEETSNNPFKMTPQSTWAAPTQDGASDNGSKSILAPSKLTPAISSLNKPVGVFGCSIPPPSASATGSILKPSALGASRLGGITAPTTPPTGASKRFCLPTVTVSSSPSESRPAFKLKPSVLRGSASSTSSPTSSAKNAFTAVPCNTSPKRSSEETEPEAKKRCTRDNNSLATNENNVDVNNGSCNLDITESSFELQENSTENALLADAVTCEVNGAEVNGSSVRSVGGEGTNDSASGFSAPSFVPLNVDVTSKDESGSKVNGVSSGSFSPNLGGGFIFGQNLQSRVTGISSNLSLPPTNGEMLRSEGNLFTEAATSLTPVGNSTEGGKSLSESSRELSEKEQSLKRKYEEVEVVTGEENEKNVIQMNCKLYGWVNGSWQERGRGILRLNDREVRDELHSRLVIRTQGTLTVMLNAKVFAEMSIEKSNDKSVRFTATGTDGQPKIYLVMGSPKDITLLHNSLEYRVAAARSQSIDEKERAKIDSST